MATIIRPAELRDAEFLGWACVMASRSQLKRGWFEIVLLRDDAFCFEFAKYLTLAGAGSGWHWPLFRSRRWTAWWHRRCAALATVRSMRTLPPRWRKRLTAWGYRRR